MLYDLVLHGVGGSTVEEARATLTHDEFVGWCSYMRKRGTVDLGARMDAGFAMLAHVICAVNGRKTKVSDFMPKRQEEQQEVSIESVFGMLKAKSKEKVKRG